MKVLITSILIIISATNIFAQPSRNYPEKLTLLFNDDIKVMIESYEILNIPNDSKQDFIFKNLVSDIIKIQDSLSTFSVPLLIYSTQLNDHSRKLNIANISEAKAEFIFTDNSDTVVSNFFNYRIEYNLNKYNKLVIYTNKINSLSSLANVSLTDIISQIKEDIKIRDIPARNAKTCFYQIHDNRIESSKVNYPKYRLSFSPGMDFGLSYLNDHFLSHASLSAAYVHSYKGTTKSISGISLEAFANKDPVKSYSLQTNLFVDAFINLKYPNHPYYYFTDIKFFVGRIVLREGDMFPKNTWRFGMDMPAGKNFRMVYTLYNNNFKTDNSGMFEVGIKYKFF